jgi:hypothetical protein
MTKIRSVYTSCPRGEDESEDFTKPFNPVRYSNLISTLGWLSLSNRDTLEQIDVAKGLIERYDNVNSLVLIHMLLANYWRSDLLARQDSGGCTSRLRSGQNREFARS